MRQIFTSSKIICANRVVRLCTCLIVLHAATASAQENEVPDTVAERFAGINRPDGLPVGAMRLFPQVGVGVFSTDNVFANDAFEESDWALLSEAELVLRSETSRYNAELGARGEFERFDDFDENDSDEWRVFFNGDTDVTATSNVEANLAYAQLNEPRTSANTAFLATELTEYDVATIGGVYTYRPSRWNLRLDARYRDFDYDDTPLLIGPPDDNSDRNREMTDYGARIGYDFADEYGFFLEGRIDDADYDENIKDRQIDGGGNIIIVDTGIGRGYDGYEVRLGTELKLTGLIMGEFYVGYLSRDFDNPEFDTSDGASYGASIDWVVTELMTFRIDGSRTTEPTTVEGASIILESQVSLGIDYELLRNLVLSTDFTYSNDDFENISREDDNKIFTLGAQYRMNRRLWFSAGYRYWDRDISSGDPGAREFTINEFTIGLTYQI
jgi:hypothetical protein